MIISHDVLPTKRAEGIPLPSTRNVRVFAAPSWWLLLFRRWVAVYWLVRQCSSLSTTAFLGFGRSSISAIQRIRRQESPTYRSGTRGFRGMIRKNPWLTWPSADSNDNEYGNRNVTETKYSYGCSVHVLPPPHVILYPPGWDNRDHSQQAIIRDMIHQRPEHLGMRDLSYSPAFSLFPRRSTTTQPIAPPSSPTKTPLQIPMGNTYSSTINSSSVAKTDTTQEELQGTTLGDIMSNGLVTEMTKTSSQFANQQRETPTNNNARQSLAEAYGFDNPLDRMVLTANGNLQRLISSYYDAPVSVYVDYQCKQQQRQQGHPQTAHRSSSEEGTTTNTTTLPVVWDRVVHLNVLNRTFCIATSVITVRDPFCVTLVESGQVGLGQLFRYLDLLPEFSLVSAGHYSPNDHSDYSHGIGEESARSGGRRSDELTSTTTTTNGKPCILNFGFWREYTLECPELSCRIHEQFIVGLWQLDQPQPL